MYRSLGWCCFNGCSSLGIYRIYIYSNQFETRELIGHVLFFQIDHVTSLLPRLVCLLEVQYLSEAFREVFVEWLFFRDLLAFYITLE